MMKSTSANYTTSFTENTYKKTVSAWTEDGYQASTPTECYVNKGGKVYNVDAASVVDPDTSAVSFNYSLGDEVTGETDYHDIKTVRKLSDYLSSDMFLNANFVDGNVLGSSYSDLVIYPTNGNDTIANETAKVLDSLYKFVGDDFATSLRASGILDDEFVQVNVGDTSIQFLISFSVYDNTGTIVNRYIGNLFIQNLGSTTTGFDDLAD
ncbi:MAG: hypothetical protein WCR56_04925 [Bacilli bacterium]